MEKVLSISIASYNVEKFLENTVKSLTGNEEILKKIEVIIVNDGSKDATPQIAKELQKKYGESIVVIDKENGGYGSTINSSLAVAKGKFFKLLDGDDWFYSDNLPMFVEYLSSADADIVISPYYDVKKQEELNDRHSEIPSTAVSMEDLAIKDLYFAMHEIAIKTELLRKHNRSIAEHCFYTDAEFVFYCVVAADTISRFDKPVYCYRLDLEGQSVSLTGLRKHYKDLPVVSKRIYTCYEQNKQKLLGTKKDILTQSIETITYNTYRTYMLLEDPYNYKTELQQHDRMIKEEHKDAYRISNRSKMIRLTRLINFAFYKSICKYAMKKFMNEVS